MSDVLDIIKLIINITNRNSVENNTVATVVDRFKFLRESINSSDAMVSFTPVRVFKETLGVQTVGVFRLNYGRLDYDRLGWVGGTDSISYSKE